MILSYLQGIIGVIFAFSVAIFVHELGHFMFAKLFGVRVETFSIGFGKRLWGFKRGDTEYKIAAIPFGGYVKMVGTLSKELEDVLEGKKEASEDERESAAEAAEELSAPASVSLAEGIQDEVNALRNKPYWQKLLVFSAGCINNILTAMLIYFLMNWIGHHQPPPIDPVVGRIDAVPAAMSPLQAGDKIVAINDDEIEDYEDFVGWFADKEKLSDFKKPAQLQIVRGGTTMPLELPLNPPVKPVIALTEIAAVADEPVESPAEAREEAGELLVDRTTGTVAFTVKTDAGTTTVEAPPIAGTGPWWPVYTVVPNLEARIALVLPNLPAEKAGFKNGDVILSINDQQIMSQHEAAKILKEMPGEMAHVVVRRDTAGTTATTLTLDIKVRPDPDNPEAGQIGVMFSAERTVFVRKPFFESLVIAVKEIGASVTRYIDALDRIFGSSFRTIRENLAGPIGISVQFFKVAQSGWFTFLMTFALFNIILALTNLLPLPVLDGGHILFATIEAIIRRPLPAKVMVAIYNLFTFLIIGLALVITFNDLIMNAWRLPFMGE